MPRSRCTKRRRVDDDEAAGPADSAPSADRLSDPNHARQLQIGMARVWRAGELCDVNVRVPSGDGTTNVEVKAHASVLLAMCPPLARMLIGDMSTWGEDGGLPLPALAPEAVRSVVEYIYTGSMELQWETVAEVLAGCAFLGLDGGRALCTEYLASKLVPENALGVGQLANKFSCEELEEEAEAFAEEHFEALMGGGEWASCSAEEVGAWLAKDSLRVTSELTIIEGLARWAERDSAARSDAFAALFADPESVRLSKLSAEVAF